MAVGNSMVAVARRLNFIRETEGANAGLWVEFILRRTGNRRGEAWCAAFASLILSIVYRGRSPIGESAGCDELLNPAKKKSYAFSDWTKVQPGDLIFWMRTPTDAHHVAIATGRAMLTTGQCWAIAGNTSGTEDTDNGDGTFEKVVSIKTGKLFVRLPEAA